MGEAEEGGEEGCKGKVTREQLLPILERERSVILAHQENLKSKNTPNLKWHCRQASNYLEDADDHSTPPEEHWGIVTFALQQAAIHRKVVDEAVATYGGYNIEEI